MNKAMQLIEKLKKPAREFSPMPFWFINDELSDDEIIRQLNDFNNKGVYGVVLHPRIGLPDNIEYLSDDYMHYIHTMVKTASELDMKIILYDEAMYPSGSAHGLVVKSNPRFASQCIILSDDTAEGKLIAETKSGKYIMQVESKGTIRGIHYGEDDGEENAPLSADLLSRDSVSRFIELTHERYYSVLKEFFGNTVIGFFTDEPSAIGRCARPDAFAWTWNLENIIESLGGDLSELEGLFTGVENDTIKLYKKTVFERENDIYYNSLSVWCENHGIALMGHPHRGDDIECERYFHIPGQDMVLRWVSPEEGSFSGGMENAQGKCSADAARIFGRRRNSNECFGACNKDNIPWNFSAGDLKWYTDWLGVRGVNMFIPHAFYYSVSGKRKDERPPDVGPNNIWWKYFDTISMYISRISCLMTDSHNCAKVCVMCENRDMPVNEVVPFYENQIEFNYVPYSAVNNGLIRDDKLIIGDNSYEYVLSDKKKHINELKKINGIQDLPYRDIYLDEPCPSLRCAHIVKDGVDTYFLTNEGEEEICVNASLPHIGALISMNFWTGDVRKLSCESHDGKTSFELSLKRRESMLVIVDTDSSAQKFDEPVRTYIKPDFTLVSDDKNEFKKTYRASVNYLSSDNIYLKFTGKEMAECFVNGSFAGFSLWNRHEFHISPFLTDGLNIIEVVLTGSAVNRYTNYSVDYGLSE